MYDYRPPATLFLAVTYVRVHIDPRQTAVLKHVEKGSAKSVILLVHSSSVTVPFASAIKV